MSGLKDLQQLCNTVRKDIVRMIYTAGSGHPGGSLSSVEIMVSLYFTDIFRCFPENPDNPTRDRFILSKGHAAPLQYSILARKGYFPVKELKSLRTFGSPLQGHPNMKKLSCLDCSAGSLGQGLSIANGIAFSFKHTHCTPRVYCLMGDGEQQEGQVWEAALFAAQNKLDNVCAIIDCNGIQLDGSVKDIKNMEPLDEKWHSFGWNVIKVNGHDITALHEAYKQSEAHLGTPTVILAATTKGKGISYMENQAKWHGTAPNAEQYAAAIAELSLEVQ